MSRRNICSAQMKRIYFATFLCIGINLIIFNFFIYKSHINLLDKNWAQFFSKIQEVPEKNFIGKKVVNEDLELLKPPKPLEPPPTSEITVTKALSGLEHPVENLLSVGNSLETKHTAASLGVKHTTVASFEVKKTTAAYFVVNQTTEASLGVKQTIKAFSRMERTTGAFLMAQPSTETFLGLKNRSEMFGSTKVSIKRTDVFFNRSKLPTTTENSSLAVWPVLVELDIFDKPAVEMIDQGQNLKICPKYPLGSVGKVNVSVVNYTEVENILNFEEIVIWLQPGGHYEPPCLPKQTLALIIPLKNSTKVLSTFLLNTLPLLRAQLLNYTIFVAQQEGLVFNEGQLMNAAYLEALKIHNFTCFIFHNPEKVPKNFNNVYQCSKSVRILSKGVFAVHRDVFRRINGFSNKILGENGGDYDLKFRLDRYGIRATKPRKDVGEYELLTDIKESVSEERRDTGYDYKDGLSNLEVKVKSVQKLPSFTKILVEIGNVTKKVL